MTIGWVVVDLKKRRMKMNLKNSVGKTDHE